MTDISTVAFSTPRAKDERRGGGKVAEGGKPVDKGDFDYVDHVSQLTKVVVTLMDMMVLLILITFMVICRYCDNRY